MTNQEAFARLFPNLPFDAVGTVSTVRIRQRAVTEKYTEEQTLRAIFGQEEWAEYRAEILAKWGERWKKSC